MSNENLAVYKFELKNKIEDLLNNGNIEAAKSAIKQYESIDLNDIDVYSMKAICSILEHNYDRANQLLNKGLERDKNNFDLLYNKAYLYELEGHKELAVEFYSKALQNTEDFNLRYRISNIIDSLHQEPYTAQKNIEKKKILIGSPVNQKPNILKEFLTSLQELKKSTIEITYVFIDDNSISESSILLEEFKNNHANTIIYKSENQEVYNCDANTHYWKESLIWKVAKFKNIMIDIAKEYNFDYLFLIDSDLVLNPITLEHLVSLNLEIVSNIFWTKWTPDSAELPQVWLKDTYTMYNANRNEELTNQDIYERTNAFINQLRIPGTYEVGGLGACTLISKEAIQKGVSFKEIKNLSFWGEDRHFCIRAAALGIPLHVNTHYPAFHIYREEDLKRLNEYKVKNRISEKKRITLVYTNFSGSNTLSLYKNIPEDLENCYDIELIKQTISEEYFIRITNSDIVVLTEGNYLLNKRDFNTNQVIIDLWHGFPLKAMGYVDKNEKFKDRIASTWENINYITSYSDKFNEVMNKCIDIPIEKYIVTGAPRNDLLLSADGKKNLMRLIGKNFYDKKIIMFMPTYRFSARGNRYDGEKKWTNIFGFKNFDNKSFDRFLEKNNIIMLIKLHPAEELYFEKNIDKFNNIIKLTNQMFEDNNMDLYEVLNACDLLITDYSSVYFDFLLLDRPVIFTPVDQVDYENNRGFLLEPYEEWTPGPKVANQDMLTNEIIKCFENKEYYSVDRKRVNQIVNRYTDCKSSERVWNFISCLCNQEEGLY